MSLNKQRHEAARWLQTAEEDLAAACSLRTNGHYAQCCFLCQQAAEKALKALWFAVDADPWGHSVQKLISGLPAETRLSDWNSLLHTAGQLDRLYIPTRYPNGIPDLTPGQTYFEEDADTAVGAARQILAAVAGELAALKKPGSPEGPR